MYDELFKQVKQVLEPLLKVSQLDLFSLSIRRQGWRYLIEIRVDKTLGGITIEECARFNRAMIETIEAHNLIPDDYILEVSSPGVDWPLMSKKDFMRVLKRRVKFYLTEDLNAKLEFVGVIDQVYDDQVLIRSDSEEFAIPFEKIKKAVQVIEE